MHIPPIGGAYQVSSGSDPDNDPAFIQLVDAAWEAIGQFQQNPDALNAQVAMQEVNKLNAYFNGVAPPSDSKAAAVYTALGSVTDKTSLAYFCSLYGPGDASVVKKFIDGTISFNGLNNALDPFGSVYNDQNTPDGQAAEQAMKHLHGALQLYNWYMQQSDKDPNLLDPLLLEIANDIRTLNAATAPGKVSDGYLTILNTMLNTPLTPGGSDTLEALSAALGSSPNPDYQGFQAALLTINEGTSNNGGDLLGTLGFSINKEWPS